MENIGTDIGKRLDFAIKSIHYSKRRFALESGISPSTLTEISKGRTKNISIGISRLLEEHGVSANWIATGSGKMFLEKEQSKTYSDNKQIVPLLGSIAAGLPSEMVEWQGEYVRVDSRGLANSKKYFALRVRGDSMEGAGIFEGDIAVLQLVEDWQLDIRTRDIVAVAIENESTLKRFYYNRKENKIVLKPENQNYEEIILQGKETTQVKGVMIMLIRKTPALARLGQVQEEEQEEQEEKE